jgi:hypothetical protein
MQNQTGHYLLPSSLMYYVWDLPMLAEFVSSQDSHKSKGNMGKWVWILAHDDIVDVFSEFWHPTTIPVGVEEVYSRNWVFGPSEELHI